MLGKIEKKFCDAHFHYAQCLKNEADLSVSWKACSCAHSPKEWEIQAKATEGILKSFGLHPQSCLQEPWSIKKSADFLEGLLLENERAVREGKAPVINAIGEAGFDYFTPEFKERRDLQEEMWRLQLELAAKFAMPLVVHCRKANEKLFEYSAALKKLPGVLFHSFMGSAVEAQSLVRRGINCCFSFGKQLMNGNKKAIECVSLLPPENLLLETDAPFQTLRGENFTKACEIALVYETAAKLRNDELAGFSDFLEENFFRIFSLR